MPVKVKPGAFYPEPHEKGWWCATFYQKQQDARLCSCGRAGIGLTEHDRPVCSFHNRFPTLMVKHFPPPAECPGPHGVAVRRRRKVKLP